MILRARFLRRQLGRVLDVEVSEEHWAWLVIHGDLTRALTPGGDPLGRTEPILDLIATLRETLRAFGQLQPRVFEVLPGFKPEDSTEEEYSRHRVLSRLAARDAAVNGEVVRFRTEYLAQGPVEVSEIESQIIQWYRLDAHTDVPTLWPDDPTVCLDSVPLSSQNAGMLLLTDEDQLASKVAATLKVRANVLAADAIDRCSWQLLVYGALSPTQVQWHMEARKIPIVMGGALERLQRLSILLGEQYGWTEAQSTTFIMTGLAPLRLPIDVWTDHNEKLPGLSVIHLAVDPGMSPKEVGDAYLEERKRLLGTRYRDLSEKHLALAVHTALLPRQLQWGERMWRWNNQYADRGWGYTQVANFSHDCLQALRRLLRSKVPLGSTAESAASEPGPALSETPDSEEARYVETWA